MEALFSHADNEENDQLPYLTKTGPFLTPISQQLLI